MMRKWILNSIIKSRPAKKPIVQLNRIESLPDDSQLHGHFKLACISDKEKFIRAVFTKDSLVQLEQKGTSLEEIRGGLISLQDYAMIASIGTDRRFSEYFVEVHKFTFIGGERNMAIPTVTNINLDERVQSKLARLWREEHSNYRADSYQHSALTVYSQMEDAPQLSQDELSMLLVAMSEQSQVDSIEAISSSQIFELENIPGWLKPEKDPQLTEQVLIQETNYATPLIEETFITALSRSDPSSHDTPTSDAAFKTPPEGLISPLVVNKGMRQQQGREVQQMNDNEEPLDLTTMPLHSSALLHNREAIQCTAPVQQLSVEGVKDMSRVLEQGVQNASEVLLESIPVLHVTVNNQEIIDNVGPNGAVHERTQINRLSLSSLNITKSLKDKFKRVCGRDDMDEFTEISRSQVKDLDAVWAKEQSTLPSVTNRTTEEQPCSGSSDILLASDTPNNRHHCNDNEVSSNGCPEHTTATSSRGQEDQPRVRHQQQQQVTRGKQSIDKGKGGTTKDIYQVGEQFNTTNGTTHGDHYDVMDDDISISSSQRDELDRQWVVGDDDSNHSSSLETFEDLHPFQLTSLPDPSKKVTDVHQPVTKTGENEPGPSGIVAMDTAVSDFVLNQEAKRRMVVNDDGMDIDTPDQQLLCQVETVTSPAPAKMQTCLVSTAAITGLLDVSNKIPPVNGAIGNKTIPQSSGASGNTRLTPSRTMTSNHNRTQADKSKWNTQDLVTHNECVITTHDDTNCSSDIINPPECLNDQSTHHFKPLTSEEDIDEFIDNYWMLQQLRTFSF